MGPYHHVDPAISSLGEPMLLDPDYDLPESVSAAFGVRASAAIQRANAMMWHKERQGLPERTFDEVSVW